MIAAVSVMGYDAYNVAVDAIERAQSTDPNAIYEALKSTNWEGITGNISSTKRATRYATSPT